ncbi:hypothetical protein KP003_16800 [Geomonas nitrogeniifigens]|uniref:hypothetical protein n=1 Tax=Geomonas diazotrophica TaxID=2843197 RepID=UPI001C2C9E48|nr:hypothetical protein [Geomonas nitrogeniifigens]QXE86001.1 hypothetical protein KP003_16800 [Geomonas nitrogeniifigens]
MIDISKTTTPKSDQLNFDDFVGGQPMTIKITKVTAVNGDQPIAVHYENDNGKPWKPCKSMRRVLVNVWGRDGNEYVGRSLILYGDPTVAFGGAAVGGIRISHMSHIDAPFTMALTATRASRKPFTVKPLVVQAATLTTDQRKEIVAAMGDAVQPAELLAHFKVKSTSEIPADKFAEVLKWVDEQKAARPPE